MFERFRHPMLWLVEWRQLLACRSPSVAYRSLDGSWQSLLVLHRLAPVFSRTSSSSRSICNALVASASLSPSFTSEAFCSPGHGTSCCIRRGKSAKRPTRISPTDLRTHRRFSHPARRRCTEHLLCVCDPGLGRPGGIVQCREVKARRRAIRTQRYTVFLGCNKKPPLMKRPNYGLVFLICPGVLVPACGRLRGNMSSIYWWGDLHETLPGRSLPTFSHRSSGCARLFSPSNAHAGLLPRAFSSAAVSSSRGITSARTRAIRAKHKLQAMLRTHATSKSPPTG